MQQDIEIKLKSLHAWHGAAYQQSSYLVVTLPAALQFSWNLAVFTSLRPSPLMPGIFRYLPLLLGIFQYLPVSSITSRHLPLSSATSRLLPLLPGTSQYIPVPHMIFRFYDNSFKEGFQFCLVPYKTPLMKTLLWFFYSLVDTQCSAQLLCMTPRYSIVVPLLPLFLCVSA